MKQRYDQISLDEYTFKKVEVRLCLREGDPYYSAEPISSPDQAVNIMGQLMKDLDREMVAVINLDTKHRPLNYNIVSIGSINASLAPIQNIMKSAMLCNAVAILLVHNHPSGSPAPSKEDMQLTEKVIEAGKLMELPLLDHVIIGKDERFDKVVAGNVIHLLPEPENALHELERVVKPGGKIIIPTYINMSKGTGTAAVKLITLLGADFKRQFDLDSYKKFFEEKGYTDVEYHVVDGRMPCAIAVINKTE